MNKIIIKRVQQPQWVGLADAAKRLKCSPTQVRRHVSGVNPSMSLERRMKALNIEVRTA